MVALHKLLMEGLQIPAPLLPFVSDPQSASGTLGGRSTLSRGGEVGQFP